MTADNQRRRLATILAADVFGYSRLMAENEEDALRTRVSPLSMHQFGR